MCEPSAAENNDEKTQQEESQQLQSEQGQVFGENQGLLQQLTQAFTPTVNAGPSQEGYSAAEKTNLDTQATESTAAGYAAANRTLKENQAAEGGGNEFLPSGAQEEESGQLAAEGENQEGSLKSQILTNDYAQGNENYNAATAGLAGVAAEDNPTGYGGVENQSASGASTTANQIVQNSDSVWNSVISGLSGVAGSAAKVAASGGFGGSGGSGGGGFSGQTGGEGDS